ncbi:MAG: CotH kinase family protein, partial [Pseudomonadota bacterium]
ILRMAGVPAAQTAFYRVFIDFGAGLKYCGVYTMVEVIDDTMVKDQLEARLKSYPTFKRTFEYPRSIAGQAHRAPRMVRPKLTRGKQAHGRHSRHDRTPRRRDPRRRRP